MKNEQAKRPIVTLAIEHKEREIRSKALVARALALSGFRVFLGTTEAIDIISGELPPSIIFHKSTFWKRSGSYRSMGHKFVFLDEEGGPAIPRSELSSFILGRYHGVSDDTCDLVLVPSETYAELIKSHTSLASEKIVVTGWPRFDIWRSENKAMLQLEAEKIRHEIGRYFLFPSFFGFTHVENLHHDNKFTGNWQVPSVERFKIENFTYVIDFLKGVAKKLPDSQKLVVRPHPKEDPKGWDKIFSDQENIIVSRMGDIAPWIEVSEGIIQFGSTAGVEAALAGKKIVRPNIKSQVGVTDSLSFEVALAAESPESAVELLNSPNKSFTDPLREKIVQLEKEIGTNLDESASRRIARALLSLSPLAETYSGPGLSAKIQLSAFWMGSHIKSILKRVGIIKSQHLTVWEKVPGGIKSDDLEKILGGAENSADLEVTQIGTCLIRIEKIS